LHEDTAYGSVKEPGKEDGGNLVYRKAFLALNDKEIDCIRDRRLRALVQEHVTKEKAAGKDIKAALLSFSTRKDIPGLPNGIRHVRLTKAEKTEYLVTLRDKSGKPYKSYSAGENAFVEIFETLDGKWHGEAMSIFKANQSGAKRNWRAEHPDARLVMRVFKGDLLRIDEEGRSKIVRIVRLEPSARRFRLAEHNETGILQDRHDDADDPFRWIFGTYDRLKEGNAEHVRVDELGQLWRIKPQEPQPA
jgi:CRISPR-associated endonuclease Csn1